MEAFEYRGYYVEIIYDLYKGKFKYLILIDNEFITDVGHHGLAGSMARKFVDLFQSRTISFGLTRLTD